MKAGPAWILACLLWAGSACESHTVSAGTSLRAVGSEQALSDSAFAALSARISEAGGFFDTDNLISNERGYLKVLGALDRDGIRGGAYVGVGPDQNFSYIARIRPSVAFIIDIRRDNLLQHLLLKVLMEGAPTRVEFLSALHGRPDPPAPESWMDSTIVSIVAHVDGAPADSSRVAELRVAVTRAVRAYGMDLSDDDLATLARFHRAFVEAGPGLRFTTFGRPPRPYYPTYRQLVTETDREGRPASYLADADAYRAVRELQLANRIVPVVGDLAGPRALRELGRVLREMDVRLTAFYVSNVELYLWRGGGFGRWVENLRALPRSEDAVIIRSYFPNFGGVHPAATPGYYATQTLQPASVLAEGGFSSYWEVVTRGIIPLR
ncbi:MAG: hypothetical protein P8170_15675 [Gemmatimonadota bacterium]